MRKLILKLLVHPIGLIFLINCSFENAEVDPTTNKHASSGVGTPAIQNSEKGIDYPSVPSYNNNHQLKKEVNSTTLINSRFLIKFFKELENIQIDNKKKRASVTKHKFKSQGWIKNWNEVSKKVKKAMPSVNQGSLEVISRIMELADMGADNKVKSDENLLEKTSTQFDKDIQQILNVNTISSLKESIPKTIMPIKMSLSTDYVKMKKGKRKVKLGKIIRVLILFEKLLNADY
jgi:hypothetical protein